MFSSVQNYIKDTSDATAIEYALIASLIAVAIISAVGLVGTNINSVGTVRNFVCGLGG